jgi:hypothetical protein
LKERKRKVKAMTRADLKRAIITARLYTAQITASPQTTCQSSRLENSKFFWGEAILCLCEYSLFFYHEYRGVSCAIAEAVSHSPLTEKPRFNPKPVHVGFVEDKVALGYIFH